jgi:hypothetical protein
MFAFRQTLFSYEPAGRVAAWSAFWFICATNFRRRILSRWEG